MQQQKQRCPRKEAIHCWIFGAEKWRQTQIYVDLGMFLIGKYRKIRIHCDGLIKRSTYFFKLVFACSCMELHETLVETGIFVS